MKVLLIGTDKNKSGASLSMVALAKIAQSKGIDVRIIITKHGPLEEELIRQNLEYYIVNSYNWIEKDKTLINTIIKLIKKILNITADYKVLKILNDFEPDIVHINTICSGVGARPGLKKKKLLVWHIREFVEEDHGFEFWNKKNAYSLISKSDAIIAISESVYSKFSEIFSKQNLKVIYNGIDIEKFYFPEMHAFTDEKKVEVYMGGSIAESKGQYLLIQAANYLKKSTNIQFIIHIVGSGDKNYVKKLQETVEKNNLQEVIIFEGFKNRMELEWLKADIAVVASHAEAFGRVTVEAMLSGALVIGANTAGTAEIISDMQTGLLFESGNYKDLAEKLVYAVNHKNKMREIVLNGREYAKNTFTADKNAESIIKVYKEILNQ